MSKNHLNELALYYFVDDLDGANIPATRLSTILEKTRQNLRLTSLALTFLENQGLFALFRHINGSSTVDEFRKEAKEEQLLRKKEALSLILAKVEEKKKLDLAWKAHWALEAEKTKAAALVRERDPKYIAKVKNQNLRCRYDLDFFIKRDCFPRLMNILKRLDSGKRLTEKDILWLSTDGENYYNDQLRSAYHLLEAVFYTNQFKESQDPWMAINASSHYRKCSKALIADELLSNIDIERKNSNKIKSAFFTTQGGVKRDLQCKDEALDLGKKAHVLMDQDFRPCTLVGAIYMETGHYDVGQEWYAKGIERGASERAIDSDLRSIFMRADKIRKEEIRIHLLKIDPNRYYWTKK